MVAYHHSSLKAQCFGSFWASRILICIRIISGYLSKEDPDPKKMDRIRNTGNKPIYIVKNLKKTDDKSIS